MTMRATLYPELAEKTKDLGRRGQVLAGIWAGKGTKEIAAELGLSPKTVEYHRAQLYRVFGVSDPVSLCRRAIAVGLINPKAELRIATDEGPRKAPSRKRLAKLKMPEAMPDASATHCPRICEAGRSGTSQPGRRARASSAYANFRAI